MFARLEPPAAPGPADPLETTLGEIPARLAAYPLAEPAHRGPAALRRGRQLEGDPGELQRVLPLRAGPPGALRAGTGVPPRRRRPRLGGRDPAPPRRDHVHLGRHHAPGAVSRPVRGGADPALRRAGTAQPDAQPVRRPRGRFHPVAPLRRADHGAVRPPVPPGRAGPPGLRPVRRGRLLGPGDPPGLVHLRAGPGRHGLAPASIGYPAPEAAAQRRHRPVRGREGLGTGGPPGEPGS